MSRFIIYHDSENFAKYVVEYSDLKAFKASGLHDVDIAKMPDNNGKDFPKLPEKLRHLLFFAKPDAVICYDNGIEPITPVFAFEITTATPAQDHWLQRFNNLVGCAQMHIPGAYILPFDLSNNPSFKGKLDSVFFYAYSRVMDIHGTPFYISEWTSTDKVNLDVDTTCGFMDCPDHTTESMQKSFQFLNRVLDYAIKGIPFDQLMKERLIFTLRDDMRSKAYPRPEMKNFARLKEGRFLTLSEVDSWLKTINLKLPKDIPDRIKKRQEKNMIFVPVVETRGKTPEQIRDALNKRIKDKGADPYLGQPLAFDYMFCRLGETPYERDANVIIDLSMLKFCDFSRYHQSVYNKCPLQNTDFGDIKNLPQYTMYLTEGCAQVAKNFLRVYAFTADIIVFKDGVVYFS